MAICYRCDAILPADSNTCVECGFVEPDEDSEISIGGKTLRRIKAENLTPWGYYIRCYKKYFSFSGRASRKEFFSFMAIHIPIFIFLLLLSVRLNNVFVNILYHLYFWDALIPMIAVGVRRMHDVGKSGLYFFYPIYGVLLSYNEGERGENEWGFNPKGGLQKYLADDFFENRNQEEADYKNRFK